MFSPQLQRAITKYRSVLQIQLRICNSNPTANLYFKSNCRSVLLSDCLAVVHHNCRSVMCITTLAMASNNGHVARTFGRAATRRPLRTRDRDIESTSADATVPETVCMLQLSHGRTATDAQMSSSSNKCTLVKLEINESFQLSCEQETGTRHGVKPLGEAATDDDTANAAKDKYSSIS
jgi:hypothetical protein